MNRPENNPFFLLLGLKATDKILKQLTLYAMCDLCSPVQFNGYVSILKIKFVGGWKNKQLWLNNILISESVYACGGSAATRYQN